jgi:hypothetical protein
MVVNRMNKAMVSARQDGYPVYHPLSLPNRQPIYRFTVQVAHDPLPIDVVRLPLAIHVKKRVIGIAVHLLISLISRPIPECNVGSPEPAMPM